jgi:hypothetical protein
MRHTWVVAGFGLLAWSAVASAQAVNNGNFETDANNFTKFPGYVGDSPNPTSVTGFSGPAGGYGINPGNGAGAPFRDNGNDNTNVLFIQGGGTTLTQSISGFSAGQAYKLDFDYNSRNCCGGTPGLTLSIGGQNFNSGPITPVGGTNPLYHGTINFTAGGTGTETVSITKTDAVAGDSTAVVDNLVISRAVPEPAALGLLAVGGIGLLRRKRTA